MRAAGERGSVSSWNVRVRGSTATSTFLHPSFLLGAEVPLLPFLQVPQSEVSAEQRRVRRPCTLYPLVRYKRTRAYRTFARVLPLLMGVERREEEEEEEEQGEDEEKEGEEEKGMEALNRTPWTPGPWSEWGAVLLWSGR
jgi:hypothetical protein